MGFEESGWLCDVGAWCEGVCSELIQVAAQGSEFVTVQSAHGGAKCDGAVRVEAACPVVECKRKCRYGEEPRSKACGDGVRRCTREARCLKRSCAAGSFGE